MSNERSTEIAAANRVAAGAVPPEPVASATENAAANGDAAAPRQRYLGRWIGVEGMFLNVTAKPSGGVRIENQWDLDHRGSFDGMVDAKGLRWMRDSEAVTAVPSDGDATRLKWLAGKKECLTVKTGEGYCRT